MDRTMMASAVKKRLTFLFIKLICLILLSSYYPVEVSSASSPAFVRQEISDGNDDWWDHVQEKFTTGYNFSNLAAVSYLSDGKFLNATIFLTSKFVEKPIGYVPVYGMMINADSNEDTGWEGYDYFMKVAWDNNAEIWTYTLEEWSTVQIPRILDRDYNYTEFFDNTGNNNYVHLSLDLEKLNLPKRYVVVFFIDYVFEKQHLYGISDYSNWIRIPPPEFSLTTVPSELTLRQREEEIVEVRLNSSTPIFGAHLVLYTQKVNGLESSVIPKERDIQSDGMITSDLHIQASQKAEAKPYTLQIFANISFPSQFISKEEQLKTISENVTKSFNLPITLLPSLTFEEEFSAFWNTYGGALSLVGGGFAAGFAAIVLDKLRKKNGKAK